MGSARQVPVSFHRTKAYVDETKCHAGAGESKQRTHRLMTEGNVLSLRDKAFAIRSIFIQLSSAFARPFRQQIT